MRTFTITALLLFTLRAEAAAQDVLSFLFDRGGEASITGGNPFAQSEEDISGLYEQGFRSSAGRSHPFIRLNSTIDNIYNEERSDGQMSGMRRMFRQAEVHLPLSIINIPAALRVDARSIKTSGSFPIISTQSVSYQHEVNNLTVGMNVMISEAMDWNAAVGQNTKVNGIAPDYEAGFSYQRPGVTAAVKIKSQAHSQFLTVNISKVDGILPLDFLQQGTELSLAVPVQRVLLQLNFHDDVLLPLPHFTRDNDTRFAPHGTARGVTSTALLTISNEVSGLFSFNVESVGGKGMFYSRTASYGSLNKFSLKSTAVQLGMRYNRPGVMELTSDIKWQSIQGSAAGFAENWPFVSALQSSFSQGYFDGAGAIRLFQFHAGGTMPLGEHITPGLGINFIHLIPSLQASTWQSRFLSFGERNRRTAVFPYRELDGIVLSGGMKGNIGTVSLLYSFSQIVPVRAVRIEGHGSDGSGGETVESGPSVSVRSSGGQFHQLTASFSF